MGYGSVVVPRVYCATDTVIVDNASVKATSAPHDVYQLAKEISFAEIIGDLSKFRYKFDIHNVDALIGAYGRVYRNGVAVGTEQSTVGVAWTSFSEDINTTNWTPSDKIQLYIRSGNLVHTAECRNFQLCGVGSEMLNTVV